MDHSEKALLGIGYEVFKEMTNWFQMVKKHDTHQPLQDQEKLLPVTFSDWLKGLFMAKNMRNFAVELLNRLRYSVLG